MLVCANTNIEGVCGMVFEGLKSAAIREVDMAKSKRNTMRMYLDMSPEQYKVLSEFLEKNPEVRRTQWLREAVGEAYTAATGEAWPSDPVWGWQKKTKID